MYPDLELLDENITVTNSSTIASQMRIKIEYTKATNQSGTIVTSDVLYANSVDDDLSVTIDSAFVHNSTDDYWYYQDTTGVIAADSGLINIITSIDYDANEAGNDYAGITITITVTVEVKQSDNVTWTELTSYDFSTGYPST